MPDSRPTPGERLQCSDVGALCRSAASRLRSPAWHLGGRPVPAPPHVKIDRIRSVVRAVSPSVFVETGTYRGDTAAAVAPLVDRVVTIELDAHLARAAARRFADRPAVEVHHGDSAVVLPLVLAGIDGGIYRGIGGGAVFWLDGHFSGGVTAGRGHSPLLAELRAVLTSVGPHVVLVDDVHTLNGHDGSPTVDEVRDLVDHLRPGTGWIVEDDILHLQLPLTRSVVRPTGSAPDLAPQNG